jgi:hypothetical protein
MQALAWLRQYKLRQHHVACPFFSQAQAAIKQRVQELTERRERERLRKASALGERSAYSAYRSRMASRMVGGWVSAYRI